MDALLLYRAAGFELRVQCATDKTSENVFLYMWLPLSAVGNGLTATKIAQTECKKKKSAAFFLCRGVAAPFSARLGGRGTEKRRRQGFAPVPAP
ncbi:MAG: hypothetical protein IJ729_05360 [Alloprevotella sp.]|nr:hypothetical protein [Alloprevotella sp.]